MEVGGGGLTLQNIKDKSIFGMVLRFSNYHYQVFDSASDFFLIIYIFFGTLLVSKIQYYTVVFPNLNSKKNVKLKHIFYTLVLVSDIKFHKLEQFFEEMGLGRG